MSPRTGCALSILAFALGAQNCALAANPSPMRPGSNAVQNDAPKPGIVVQGTAVYIDMGRDNIVVTLTLQGDSKEAKETKPLTATTNENGEFLFKSVPVGKYKLTAKGQPTGSLRKLKELDPVDVEVPSADAPAITVRVKLTLDR